MMKYNSSSNLRAEQPPKWSRSMSFVLPTGGSNGGTSCDADEIEVPALFSSTSSSSKQQRRNSTTATSSTSNLHKSCPAISYHDSNSTLDYYYQQFSTEQRTTTTSAPNSNNSNSKRNSMKAKFSFVQRNEAEKNVMKAIQQQSKSFTLLSTISTTLSPNDNSNATAAPPTNANTATSMSLTTSRKTTCPKNTTKTSKYDQPKRHEQFQDEESGVNLKYSNLRRDSERTEQTSYTTVTDELEMHEVYNHSNNFNNYHDDEDCYNSYNNDDVDNDNYDGWLYESSSLLLSSSSDKSTNSKNVIEVDNNSLTSASSVSLQMTDDYNDMFSLSGHGSTCYTQSCYDVVTNTFEQFIVDTCNRNRRRQSFHVKQQQSMSLLFVCIDMIKDDYNSIIELYNAANTTTAAQYDLVDMHLHASSHIVQQFLNVLPMLFECDESIARCNDDDLLYYSRSPIQVVYSDMEQYILQQLSMNLIPSSTPNTACALTPIQASKMICWYENYLYKIRDVFPNADIVQPSLVWTTDIQVLFDHYLVHGIRRELHELIQVFDSNDDTTSTTTSTMNDTNNSKEQDVRSLLLVRAVSKNHNGRLVSTRPDEIVYCIDLLMQIAAEHIPEKYLPNVLHVCHEVLSTIICNQMKYVETVTSTTNTMSILQYCTLINDMKRMYVLLHEHNQYFFLKYSNSNDDSNNNDDANHCCNENLHQLENMAKELEQQLIVVPNDVSDYLCRHIINKLRNPMDPILNSIGNRSWECDNTGSGISRTVITLLDYFTGCEKYLIQSDDDDDNSTDDDDDSNASLLFPNLLKRCFYYTIQTYVESFYLNTMTYGIRNPEIVAMNLRNDYSSLAKFFNSRLFAKHTNKAGVLSNQNINALLLLIQSMSRIMDPSVDPSDLQDDIHTILERVSTYDESNVTAILHIAGLRGKQSHIESAKWIKTIAIADAIIAENANKPSNGVDDTNDDCVLQITDLLKSPYLYIVRPQHQAEIDNLFPDDPHRTAFAQATKALLDKGYQELLIMYNARKQQREALAAASNNNNSHNNRCVRNSNSLSNSLSSISTDTIGGRLGSFFRSKSYSEECYGVRVDL